jgi:TPR repeat protein
MYEMGWGTQADKARALELYRRAAELGNPHARKNIARVEASVEQAARDEAGEEPEGMADEQGMGIEPDGELPTVIGPGMELEPSDPE